MPVVLGSRLNRVPSGSRGSASGAPIVFEEIADRAGIHFIADSCPTPNKNLPETMLAGVALLDYDNDGYLDIYFVNGAAIPSLKKDSPKYWNRLFHNNHDGTFTDVTEKAGVKGEGYGMGVAVGDYDNDGWPDIFLANVTKNQLFHNNHDGTFTDVTDKAGVGGGVLDGKKMWAVAAGWFDYDNDGRLDLFVSNYCKWEVNKDPFCGPNPNVRTYCHPKNYAPLPNTLYHNNGDGTFTDVSAADGYRPDPRKGNGGRFCRLRSRRIHGRLRGQRQCPEHAVPQFGRQEIRGGGAADGRGVSRVRLLYFGHGRRFPGHR